MAMICSGLNRFPPAISGSFRSRPILSINPVQKQPVRSMREKAPPDEVAMLIAEERNEARAVLRATHKLYCGDKLVKQWLPPSMHAELSITRIKGPPNFASKDEEVLLQISDACAFVLQRYLKEGSNADRFLSAMLGNFVYPIDLGLLKSAAGSYSCLWWPTEQEALERSFIRIAPGLGAEQFS